MRTMHDALLSRPVNCNPRLEITVLFADLSSFTELTHDLGAERTHEVIDAFLRMATDVLVKHGAFIDKYIGDAVMALFNVPIRYEDHARRAIIAAGELQSEIGDHGALRRPIIVYRADPRSRSGKNA